MRPSGRKSPRNGLKPALQTGPLGRRFRNSRRNPASRSGRVNAAWGERRFALAAIGSMRRPRGNDMKDLRRRRGTGCWNRTPTGTGIALQQHIPLSCRRSRARSQHVWQRGVSLRPSAEEPDQDRRWTAIKNRDPYPLADLCTRFHGFLDDAQPGQTAEAPLWGYTFSVPALRLAGLAARERTKLTQLARGIAALRRSGPSKA